MLRKRVLNIMLANTICLVAQSQTLMAGGLLLVSLSYSGDIQIQQELLSLSHLKSVMPL